LRYLKKKNASIDDMSVLVLPIKQGLLFSHSPTFSYLLYFQVKHSLCLVVWSSTLVIC